MDVSRRGIARTVVALLETVDEGIDEIAYRPAVVKAFGWLPRWWLCDLAKLSMRLDERWQSGWWADNRIEPGGPCQACGRRAAIHVYGGLEADEESIGDYAETHPVYTCGWCHLRGPLATEDEVKRALRAARKRSIAWRWRWRVE